MYKIKEVIAAIEDVKHELITKDPMDANIFKLNDAIEYLYLYEDLRES